MRASARDGAKYTDQCRFRRSPDVYCVSDHLPVAQSSPDAATSCLQPLRLQNSRTALECNEPLAPFLLPSLFLSPGPHLPSCVSSPDVDFIGCGMEVHSRRRKPPKVCHGRGRAVTSPGILEVPVHPTTLSIPLRVRLLHVLRRRKYPTRVMNQRAARSLMQAKCSGDEIAGKVCAISAMTPNS